LRSIGNFALKLESLTRADERLAVNFVDCQALINGAPVSLTPTETKLLYILMRDAGKLVTTDFLLRRLWPHELAYQDRLRVYVHRLRSKIEENPEEPRYVVSRRNKGYSFLPRPEEAKDGAGS
jgi:DNA-binding response OmpR family regulator